ncbi:UNVERIFIED_CONTAM: Retrovirus-related Pol polyprotein from transposon TNT 1-94 [Sesamum calycinum]|uniref:Retrovirus-related Pol polyprotein from transposon TNT 1-94 n=1 Tax=Sesamum calycinum TaxID=2727403 RepID=A0AAW2J226_9LAMI
MVENRPVAEQTHEVINFEHALVDAEMKLLEKFLVMSDTGPSFVLIKRSKLGKQLAVNMVVGGSSGASTLGAIESLPIHQMEVKIAFLYGELDEKIYMDQPEGFIVHGSCLEIITETKSFLKNKFEMKDIGDADVILGVKLIRSTDGIAISQFHYVEKIIEKFEYQK